GTHTVVASEAGATGTASLTTLDTKGPTTVLNSAVVANGQVTLTGSTGEAGDTVQVWEGYNLIGTAQTKSDGSFTVVGSAPDAYHVYGAVASDIAGNTGPDSTDIGSTTGTATTTTTPTPIPTAAAAPADPSMPSVTLSLANETGASATDHITSNPSLTGTADAGSIVHFSVDGSAIGATAAAGAMGTWSFPPIGLADGQHVIEALDTNASGETGAAFLTFTLDATGHDPSFTGASATNGNVTLTGTTGEVGDMVNIYDGNSWIGATSTGTDGTWHFTATAGTS